MKIKNILCLQIICLINSFLNAQSFVTYEVPSERLGDKLISYIHAKWLSYKYDLTLLYRPFHYSDKFEFSRSETPFEQAKFKTIIRPSKGDNPNYLDKGRLLFDIKYFPESKEEFSRPDTYASAVYHFDVDFKDREFRKLLRKALSPIEKIETIKPPTDCISVALHVRKNSGGYDFPLSYEVIERLGYLPEGRYTDFDFPLKHPSDDYYIEQIKRVADIFEHQGLYIFLFTDDPLPGAIVEKYQKVLSDYKNITFDYRKKENRHDLNVLEDLFSMPNFDVYIRADSNLGFVISIIGDFKLLISPKGYKKIGHKIIINEVNIESNL